MCLDWQKIGAENLLPWSPLHVLQGLVFSVSLFFSDATHIPEGEG